MIKNKILKKLVGKLIDKIPSNIDKTKKILKNNFHEVILKFLKDFDIVSREEFKIQVEVLRKTREMIEKIESRISKLEKTKK